MQFHHSEAVATRDGTANDATGHSRPRLSRPTFVFVRFAPNPSRGGESKTYAAERADGDDDERRRLPYGQ
jgi:hypothetical protein